MERMIKAGDFKAKCLKVMDQVQKTHRPVIVTKYGRPLVKVVPLDQEPSLFGYMRGTLQVVGDIISPIDEEWDACR